MNHGLPGLRDLVPVPGGDIARSYRARTDDGQIVFVKTRDDAPLGMFAAEAASLRWLAHAAAIDVPVPIAWDEHHLVLPWIDHGAPDPSTDERLGHGLALLHAAGAPCFGLDSPANLATIPLDNTPTESWAEFYWSRRIEPLARRAVDVGAIPADELATFDRLAAVLDDRCGPPEPPARLHGDLWAGNVVVDRRGRPWLVDPSSYGGHREVDLAMLDLFGGLPRRLVDAYDETRSLAGGWRERLALWQLLPLLTHAVLFGGGYGHRAVATARSVVG